MREILFRGKREDNGEWVYGYYSGPVGLDPSHEICDINDMSGSKVDVDLATVGQYTGLTDKNGKKIFEGDVVKGFNTFHCREERYIVCYKEIGFFFCENENEWHPEHIEEKRVIGNIHDKLGGAVDD